MHDRKVDAVNVSTGISKSVRTDDAALHVLPSLAAGTYNLIRHPHVDIEEGHLTNLMCHRRNISMKPIRPLRWDPEKAEVQDDLEAHGMCSRPYRKPWTLMEEV